MLSVVSSIQERAIDRSCLCGGRIPSNIEGANKIGCEGRAVARMSETHQSFVDSVHAHIYRESSRAVSM